MRPSSAGSGVDRNGVDGAAVVTGYRPGSPHRDVALVDHYRTGMDGTVVSVCGGVISSVVFVTPNNPTGTTIPATDIFDFAPRHPRQAA